MEVKRIVTAVDFGPDTEAVVSYAAWLARLLASRASLELLHVMDYALTPPTYLVRYLEDEKKKNLVILDRWSQRLRDEQDVDVGYDVVSGHLIDAIGSYIREKEADVLVIGYKQHMLRSSSAGRLIRSLSQPMLVVKGAKSSGVTLGKANVRRILCPVDFSDSSRKAVQLAGYLAKRGDADLTVLHAKANYLLTGTDRLKRAEEIEGLDADALTDAANELPLLVDELDAGRPPRAIVRSGEPVAVINEICRELDIDMIVMGARGKTFFQGLLLGSVSESVIRSSSCPVFIIHWP